MKLTEKFPPFSLKFIRTPTNHLLLFVMKAMKMLMSLIKLSKKATNLKEKNNFMSTGLKKKLTELKNSRKSTLNQSMKPTFSPKILNQLSLKKN